MKTDQELYKRLRALSKEELWNAKASRFDAASPRDRMENVAVIRAVGMIFSRFGTEEEKRAVREWLMELLHDPQEKIRRYAMTALPKIGGGEGAEAQMLSLLETCEDREQRHLGRALEKVGGLATLVATKRGISLPSLSEQKVKAAVMRKEKPSVVRMQALLPADPSWKIFLRCRRGLEKIVREEAEELLPKEIFLMGEVKPGCLTLMPLKPFSLALLYKLRCFATVGFSLGSVSDGDAQWVEKIASTIGSAKTRTIMLAATEGAARYRLDFAGRGHQRGTLRQVVDRAYSLSSQILNDAREAPWSIDVIPVGLGGSLEATARESSLELRPRLYPDPRLFYRRDDIAAASHPPLAACMARLAFEPDQKVIWDPFCGSGLELIERSLLGGVIHAYGTDLDPKAIEVARVNFVAAQLDSTLAEFTCSDFRGACKTARIQPGSVSLIITNPPLGRRVRVKDMQGLFADLYAASGRALRSGGRLIFVNPLRSGPSERFFKLEYRQSVDLGGFNCRLELYRKR